MWSLKGFPKGDIQYFILHLNYFVKDWRCMIDSCYLWRKMSHTLGLSDLKNCDKESETEDDWLCRCGQSLNRRIRCRKNFRNGKYSKEWCPNFDQLWNFIGLDLIKPSSSWMFEPHIIRFFFRPFTQTSLSRQRYFQAVCALTRKVQE